MQAMSLKAGTSQPPPGGSGGFPSFDTSTYPSQVFWLAITFTILLVFLWRFVVPRIGGTINERKQRIAQELAQAEQDRREADQALAEAEARLAKLRAEAREHIRRAAQEAAAGIVERLIGESVSPEEAAEAVAAVEIR